jgi:hypothetical protein
MSTALKKVIREFTDDPLVLRQVDRIATCDRGQILEMCPNVSGGRGEKTKRGPSAYNTFAGECLRNKHLTKFDPEAMKDCARQWHNKKK